MKKEVEDAADRLRRLKARGQTAGIGNGGPDYNPTGRAEPEAVMSRIWRDEGVLAEEFLAEHPADDDDAADTTFLEETGFLWSADGESMYLPLTPGWELLCVIDGNSRSDNFCNATSFSLCFEYQGGSPRVRAIFGLADHPTRRYVRRIILVFKGECP